MINQITFKSVAISLGFQSDCRVVAGGLLTARSCDCARAIVGWTPLPESLAPGSPVSITVMNIQVRRMALQTGRRQKGTVLIWRPRVVGRVSDSCHGDKNGRHRGLPHHHHS
jgi:hypothetical protein